MVEVSAFLGYITRLRDELEGELHVFTGDGPPYMGKIDTVHGAAVILREKISNPDDKNNPDSDLIRKTLIPFDRMKAIRWTENPISLVKT